MTKKKRKNIYKKGNFLSCFLSEVACDLFYAGTKIIIYAW